MRLILSLLLILASSLSHAQGFKPDKFETRAAIELFWEACVHQYPDRERFAAWVDVESFKEFPAEAAVGLVKEPKGRAWAIDNAGARYLMVAEDANVCTLYLKGFDREVFTQFFQSVSRNNLVNQWIAFDKVDRGEQTSDDVKLISYKCTQKGKVVLEVAVAELKPGKAFFEMSLAAAVTRTISGSPPSSVSKGSGPAERKR